MSEILQLLCSEHPLFPYPTPISPESWGCLVRDQPNSRFHGRDILCEIGRRPWKIHTSMKCVKVHNIPWISCNLVYEDFLLSCIVKNNMLTYLLLNCSNQMLIHHIINHHPLILLCHTLSSFIFIFFVFLINCMLMSKVLNKISKTLHENIFSLHTDRTSEIYKKSPWIFREI